MISDFENKDNFGNVSPVYSMAVHSEAVWGLTGLKASNMIQTEVSSGLSVTSRTIDLSLSPGWLYQFMVSEN